MKSEKYKYNDIELTVKEWAESLEMTENGFYNRIRLYKKGELKYDDVFRKKSIQANPSTLKKKDSLCWYCVKSFGGCNWSNHCKYPNDYPPEVKGWNAIKGYLKYHNTEHISYLVKECPEFIHDTPKSRERWLNNEI